MVDKVVKYIPITTIIIIYLFLCGGLHLVAFWSTFGIDISNIVSIWEIPKSFIYPFLISQSFGLFLLLNNVMAPIENNRKLEIPNTLFWSLVLQANTYIILSSLLVPFLILFNKSIILWGITGLFVGLSISFKVFSLQTVKNLIPNFHWRLFICQMIIMTPATCITLGKVNSLSIYKNRDIKYIKIANDKSNVQTFPIKDSLDFKLLGFLGGKLIVSSLDNNKIFVLNQSAFDVVEIDKEAGKKDVRKPETLKRIVVQDTVGEVKDTATNK